ncbi:polysaccharide deacetylase family protein [Chitinophaga japonensis]|uniref:Peptidoglycan/xylan/chitin deacetylase (PgdA/CDA1 family) n=1 Tax=Chitinophaga japonensis TaxID=104662 RepID=A0A562T538_CHIJA|nr:polysaccharide deacetylase family protein [Chitinophaga japonensis]TWI88364.1 peptidoglycan/xylan/chitin deacetylase (PgdA/CDA1 family) [Chitinophaga japonensis]
MTYRLTNIITFALLAVLLALHNFWQPLSWWIFVLLLILYVAVLAWGSVNIAAGFYMPVTCQVRTQEKVVALTFDDGPLPAFTPQLLDILQERQAPAAFFCIGHHVAQQEALLQRVHAEGHLVGNHSYSHHFWFDLFGADRMLEELRRTDACIAQVTGQRPHFFRPPYGVTNPNLRRAVMRGGYFPLGWSIRSLDTVAAGEEQLLHRITTHLHPGAIILLHDSREITVKILPALIDHIRSSGYRIERIDKMLNIPAYA